MKLKLFILPLTAMAIAIVGCGGSGKGVVGIHDPRVRAVNDFSDLASVSATAAGTDMMTSQAFGAVSAYTIIDSGNHTITFNDVSGPTSLPIVSSTNLLETEKYYTAVGTGTSANRTIILLEDTRDIDGNMTKARFVNADEDQANIDVYITSTATPDLTGQTPQADSLDFGQGSTYTSYVPGDYKVWITPDGSTTPITTQNVTFTTNTSVTYVFAKTSGGVTIQTLEDRPLPAGTP